MSTITLRQLARETRKVKRMTEASDSFLVTDHGKPLWKVSPATEADEDSRAKDIDAELDLLLAEPKSTYNLAEIVIQNRR